MTDILNQKSFPTALQQDPNCEGQYQLSITFTVEELVEFLAPHVLELDIKKAALIQKRKAEFYRKQGEERTRLERHEHNLSIGKAINFARKQALESSNDKNDAWKVAASQNGLSVSEARLYDKFYRDDLAKQQIERILKLSADKYSIRAIAAELGISKNAVSNALKKHKPDTSNRVIDEETCFRILEEANNGLSLRQIASLTDVSKSSVSRIINRWHQAETRGAA